MADLDKAPGTAMRLARADTRGEMVAQASAHDPTDAHSLTGAHGSTGAHGPPGARLTPGQARLVRGTLGPAALAGLAATGGDAPGILAEMARAGRRMDGAGARASPGLEPAAEAIVAALAQAANMDPATMRPLLPAACAIMLAQARLLTGLPGFGGSGGESEGTKGATGPGHDLQFAFARLATAATGLCAAFADPERAPREEAAVTPPNARPATTSHRPTSPRRWPPSRP